MNLATHNETESFVSKTQSVEYWDANTPHDKIKSISQYLEDVRLFIGPVPRKLVRES